MLDHLCRSGCACSFSAFVCCASAERYSSAEENPRPRRRGTTLRGKRTWDTTHLCPLVGDGSYWHDQLAPLAKAGFHAIADSRRYNFPNKNKARPGYSAIVDADDLAALIQKLHLGKVDVAGHSYGAFTALFLAVRRPELVRRVVLCKAPAVSLLAYLPGRPERNWQGDSG